MPAPDLCTEAEIADLVHRFYARVRADALLGPIFDAHIVEWDPHLARMVDFWSSALRGTRRYRGAPMPVNSGTPGGASGSPGGGGGPKVATGCEANDGGG